MFSKFKKLLPPKLWPYILLLLVTSVYFVYLLNDSRYFFYDDFTALKFVADRSYLQIIIDSLISRNVDRHKFIGYLVHKFLYNRFDHEINTYFLFLFFIHTLNTFLVFSLLKRLTKSPLISLFVSGVFAYRFYLWWFSNIHALLSALFFFLGLHLWCTHLDTKKPIWLLLLYLSFPLAVFSYGPTILLSFVLVPFTLLLKSLKSSLRFLLHLVPLQLLTLIYLFVFTFTADSVTRFTSGDNPYASDFSLHAFSVVHSTYLSQLSGDLLPISLWLTIAFWGSLLLLAVLVNKKLIYLIAAFFLAILANSFFLNHVVFYYLYFPIIFILVLFAYLLRSRLWPAGLLIFLVVFNPLHQLHAVAFRLKHPAPNFEQIAMQKITHTVNLALEDKKVEIQLDNWHVTPNLEHAIDYQVLPYFLSHPDKDNYFYHYSRDTQLLTLTPKLY